MDLQALNNWGLVLQELTALRPPAERAYLVDAAVSKFRRAIRLRPDFDRACYNLGTVCYAHATSLNSDEGQEVMPHVPWPTHDCCMSLRRSTGGDGRADWQTAAH